MKRIVLFSLLLVCIGACRKPEVEFVDFDSFHPISVKSADVFMESGALNPEIRLLGPLDEEGPETKTATTSLVSTVKDLLGSLQSNTLIHISGTYQGHDIDGTPLVQSGKLLVPRDGKIKNLIIVSHFTIGANFECPTESFPLEGIMASKGYEVAVADYIGFGITKDRIHPYMHTRSTARSVVDMALAVKPYLEHIGRKPESEEVILLGYSQGGSTTMAVMNMIQREFPEELPIKKVYAGGGPYDLNATFDISMEEDVTGIPCAIPMIVQGVSEGERLNLDMADFFQPDLLANYDEWINSKKYTVKEINTMIGASSLHEIMTDEGRDKTSAQTALLYKAMMNNSVLNFFPHSPVFIFHSRQDRTVPFVNSQMAEMHLKRSNVSYDFGDYGSHGTAAIHFLLKVAKEL